MSKKSHPGDGVENSGTKGGNIAFVAVRGGLWGGILGALISLCSMLRATGSARNA